ncbi:transposase DDE domain protein [Methanobrevibacter cuticularis]|uniref:Transposase DDE domain protein n=2 Tax=Methanobrevibacter cuticularis TaxID=47311 RepID=A0A166CX68_9EURY|nr:transposase DDE domain protein [Methanobrevibacter cuticularis]
MALICLMKRLKLGYRLFTSTIQLTGEICSIINLKSIPHYTTLQKFFKRIKSEVIGEIMDKIVGLFDINNPWVALDGTGHSCDQASRYYIDKIKKQSKKWRKSYTKNQIAIDTRTQIILTHRVAKGPRHDSKDAIALIRKTKKYKPIGFSLDKAYDSEEIHKVIHEELNASSLIPLKKRAKKGKYRIGSRSIFTKPKYHQRSIVETVISVIKRIFGDKNQSRSDRLRNKETKLKNLCYNIYRHTKTFNIKIKI